MVPAPDEGHRRKYLADAWAVRRLSRLQQYWRVDPPKSIYPWVDRLALGGNAPGGLAGLLDAFQFQLSLRLGSLEDPDRVSDVFL
jgi:hypothetical protein